MANPDPPKAQFPANFRNQVTPNSPAAPSPYADPALTKQDVEQPGGTVPGNNQPPVTGSVLGLGNTRRFYAADGETELNAPT